MNSIGSSSVTMWISFCWFSSLSIAASVVVLPEPVAPVTKMSPVFSLIISRKTGCSPSLSMVGITELSFRMTMA